MSGENAWNPCTAYNSVAAIGDVNGVLRLLMKSTMERMLDTEMDVHLGRRPACFEDTLSQERKDKEASQDDGEKKRLGKRLHVGAAQGGVWGDVAAWQGHVAVVGRGLGMVGAAIIGGWTGRWVGHPGLSGWGKALTAGLATMLIVSLAVWTAICAIEFVGDRDIAMLLQGPLVMGIATFFMPFQSAVSGLAVPACIAAVHLIARRERGAARPD